MTVIEYAKTTHRTKIQKKSKSTQNRKRKTTLTLAWPDPGKRYKRYGAAADRFNLPVGHA